MIRTYCTVLY